MEAATYKNTKKYTDLSGIKAWGKVVKVYDGDTIWVAIDFNNLSGGIQQYVNKPDIRKVKIRLARIDTPEIRGGSKEETENAKIARDYVASNILNKTVLVNFGELGTFDRPISEVFFDRNNKLINLSDDLLVSGLAKKYSKST